MTYTCKYCGKKLDSKQALGGHIRQKHTKKESLNKKETPPPPKPNQDLRTIKIPELWRAEPHQPDFNQTIDLICIEANKKHPNALNKKTKLKDLRTIKEVIEGLKEYQNILEKSLK